MSRAASGSTAVLEYRPTETLALRFAGCPAPRCLSRPCRPASPPNWRKTGAFPETWVKSGERRTVCWREMDSNFQYASTERWHRATDLLLFTTMKRRARLPWRDHVPRLESLRASAGEPGT